MKYLSIKSITIVTFLLGIFNFYPAYSTTDTFEEKLLQQLPAPNSVVRFNLPILCGRKDYWLPLFKKSAKSDPIFYALITKGFGPLFKNGGVIMIFAEKNNNRWLIAFRPQKLSKIICTIVSNPSKDSIWFTDKYFYEPDTQVN